MSGDLLRDDPELLKEGQNLKAKATIAQVTEILEQSITEIGGRATLYDQPDGEESMPKVIRMFNALYGTDLSVEQGWMLMVLLKAVRSANGDFKLDNYVDLAAYAAFAGKAARDVSD